MKLKILCDAAAIACPKPYESLEISSVADDSRDVVSGGLFICIRGSHTDAHDLIPQAVCAGASCIVIAQDAVIEEERLSDCVVLRTENTRRACACMYDAWYGFPSRNLKIIGITGTNGKTSVTHLLRRILECALHKCGLIGTVGCDSDGRYLDGSTRNSLANMTTPDPRELYRMLAEMCSDGVEYVLMEVTSHALTYAKTAPIRFCAAIFTNLTPEHLDFHKTMEAYADAKAQLFAQSRLAVLFADSPYAEQMHAHAAGKTVWCTVSGNRGDYCAEQVTAKGENGIAYRLKFVNGSAVIRCPIAGRFTAVNSLLAAACALELGIGIGCVQDALRSIAGIKGRMERVRLGGPADFTVMIDYAHTPDALENLLRSVREIKKNEERIVLVFGCGGDRDRSKRPLMGRLAGSMADEVIVTSDNSRTEDPQVIISQILEGMSANAPCTVIADRSEAIRHAILNAKAGDWILLAGKGHEEYEIGPNGRQAFSETDTVQKAFAERSLFGKSNADSDGSV